MKTRTIVILIVVTAVLSFLLGRLLIKDKVVVETKEVVKYESSPFIVRDTITKEKIVPKEVFVLDTLYKYISQSVDTSAIIKDYFLSRGYQLDFSSDSTGIFIVDLEVNQNKLVSAASQIQPIVKTVYRENQNVVYKVPAVQFYGMLGTSLNLDCNKISLGLDLKQKYLIGASGIRFKDNYTYTLDFGIKF